MTIEIIEGDCREVLRELEANSVDAVVTDPPYGLEFMGKDWDAPWKTDRRQTFDGTLNDTRENPFGRARVRNGSGQSYGADARIMQAFQAWCETWAVELLRVLKPGGHLLAFGGTKTYHRLASAVEDAGFEIRDQIGWLYGSGFPKSSNQEGAWEGWGTALKPAWEPIVVARKPLIGTMARNLAAHGVGALNTDGCRVAAEGGSPTVQRRESARRNNTDYTGGGVKAIVTDAEGRFQRRGDPETFMRPRDSELLGRWPANVIHDGSDEVLAAFPAAPGQIADASTSSSSRKTQNVYGEMKRGNGRENEPSGDSENEGAVGFKMKPGARRLDSGSAARFFYCAKASKKDRSEGNTHPTVKPSELMRYLCRLVTPPGGTVLDPFMGSGSTGRAAVLEGFNFVGIEMTPEYYDIADRRIAEAEAQMAPKLQAAE